MHLAGMNRYQAFGIHFGISLLIFIGLVGMVLLVWYPGILKEVDESWKQALIMIAGVDLVLGPLLTLIVFNPAKKSLKMDLSIIAIAQTAALIAGTYTVHQARPVALYVAHPRVGFEVLTANTLSKETMEFFSNSKNVFYYYSGPLLLGPHNPVNLDKSELKPTSDGGFSEFLSQKDTERENEKNMGQMVPISGTNFLVEFHPSGKFLSLTTHQN